jgi:hypothetical protein
MVFTNSIYRHLPDIDRELRIEMWIFIDAVSSVAARVAQHACAMHSVVKAIV